MWDHWWSRSSIIVNPLRNSFRSLARGLFKVPGVFVQCSYFGGRAPFSRIARFSLLHNLPNSMLVLLRWTGLGPSRTQFRLLPWVFGRIGVPCLLLPMMVRACRIGSGRVVVVGPVLVGPSPKMDLLSTVLTVWFVAGSRHFVAGQFFVPGLPDVVLSLFVVIAPRLLFSHF